MKRLGIAFIPCLMLLTAASAQLVPPPAPAPAVPLSDEAVVLALGENASRMTVPVTVGASPTYPFIIDTGAERTVISRELARVLKLQPGPQVRVTGVTGSADVGSVLVPSITVIPLHATAVTAPALNGFDIGAPGMLGLDALQDHAVAIDFARNRMAVTSSVKRKNIYDGAPDEIVVVAKSLFGQLIVTNATYAGKKIRVVIDTGAGVTMANSAFRKLMATRTHSSRTVDIMSVTGGHVIADYAMVDGVRIGGVGMNGLPVAFTDAPPFAKFGLADTPALLIGMDALRAFHGVTIDFANRVVRFKLRDAPVPELGRWSVAPA